MDSFAPRLYRRTFLSPLVLRATVASGLFSPLICLCSVNRQALLHMKPMAPANRWTKRTSLESPSCRSFRLLLPFSFSQRFIPVLSCLFFLWRLFSLSSLFLFPCFSPSFFASFDQRSTSIIPRLSLYTSRLPPAYQRPVVRPTPPNPLDHN